ncbi:MAG: ABC transporter permease [Chloroflexi bacterium]|nr:MAG: ABC transporter permease [Chloroflexota bacterium]
MVGFVARRILLMVPTVIAISVMTFAIMQLAPGDFLTSLVAGMASQGESVSQGAIDALRDRYGLGQPPHVQYLKWVSGIMLRGDFGQSFEWNRPVSSLIWDRMGFTLVLSLGTLTFTWVFAFLVGVYSAVRRYSIGDYVLSFLAFIGLAVPGFLIALVLLYVSAHFFNQSVGGLFSPEYVEAPWSLGKVVNLLQHLWIPIVIIGLSQAASLVRIMRANLLDELHKPYVVTARAKGLAEGRLLLKYPVRMAVNPFVSTVGWSLPALVSGEAVVAIVLSLPTTGPLLVRALQSKDMYLAGSFILLLSTLTVIGTLISDVMLAWLDPRIRYQ